MNLQRLAKLAKTPLFELPPFQRGVAAVGLVIGHCVPRVLSRRSQQMAAALTYHTVFSLLPTMVLVLVTLQAFVGDDDRERLKGQLVAWVVEPLAGTQPHDAMPAVSVASDFVGPPELPPEAEELSDRRQEYEDMRRVIESEVAGVLNKLEDVDFGSIGVFGFLVFIFATTGLLTTIESTFDDIFGVGGGRPLHRRLPLYYAILTLGPVVVIAGQWVQTQLLEWIRAGGWTAWLGSPLAVISPVLTSWLLLYGMFVALPTVRVRPRAAAVGSLASAICWVVAMELFGLYASTAAISSLYGALALLPISLLWVFVIWLLLLLGMEFTHAVQFMSETGRLPAPLGTPIGAPVLSAGWTLEVAARIAAAFERGETITSSAIERQTGLSRAATDVILKALERARIINLVGKGPRYGLARPAERITAAEIVALHQPKVVQRGQLIRMSELPIREEFQAAAAKAYENRTLAELAARVRDLPHHGDPPEQEDDDELSSRAPR